MAEPVPAVRLRDLDVGYDAGPVVHGVSLDVQAEELHVLLGESGSGKTTLLRAIAGFETASAGSIEIFGDVVDRGGDARAYWPPERRNVGVVFQDYALFPHLDVAGNVGFGMRRRDPGHVAALLEQVGLGGLGPRSVAELSGGQQQRVALARALAQRPRIILLDEPFSNLNRELRDELRERTASLLRAERITAIFVTHDRHEAFALADRVSVIGQGRVLQTGTCQALYELPASEVVARSVGDVNLLAAEAEAEAEAGGARCALGRVPLRGQATSGACQLMIRPGQLVLTAGEPGAEGAATVARVVYFGSRDEVHLVLESGARLVAHTAPGQVTAGERVRVSLRGTALQVS